MKKPSKEFSTRYASAKRWRDDIRPHIQEVYRFCAPGREDEFTDTQKRAEPESTVYTSIGEEAATDLAGDLVSYYTPPESRWYALEAELTAEQEEEIGDEVLDALNQREDDVASFLRKSNYFDIAPQIAFEAAAHGTMAAWVEKAHLQQPIYVETVPPSELLITPGHLGLLDRFREKSVPSWSLPALFSGMDVSFTDEISRKIDKPTMTSKVVWGFWADWSDPGRPMWMAQYTVDGHAINEPTPLGDMAGSCPLLVGRFNPQPGKPWGRGAGFKALPDMRVLNKVEEVVLTALDGAILDTIIYPDDAMIDLSEGLQHGRAYAASSRFSKDQIWALPKDANLDYGYYTKDGLEAKVRAAFYQDGPRQRGDTPPTAAQWHDERRRVQQRLGKPSAPLWTEFFYPLVQRAEMLAMQTGRLDPQIRVDGNVVTAAPISPLQMAQRHEDVMIARANLEIATAMSPEGPSSFIDPIKTFGKLVEATGDRITVLRDKEQPLAGPAAAPAPV